MPAADSEYDGPYREEPATTRQPVPFANIQIIRSSTGTSANEQGEFIFRIDRASIGFGAIPPAVMK